MSENQREGMLKSLRAGAFNHLLLMDIFSIIDFKSFSIIPKRFPKGGGGGICSHESKSPPARKFQRRNTICTALWHSVFLVYEWLKEMQPTPKRRYYTSRLLVFCFGFVFAVRASLNARTKVATRIFCFRQISRSSTATCFFFLRPVLFVLVLKYWPISN